MTEAPEEVAPGVHRIAVPLPFPPHEVAAWVIEGDEGHTLVDTGVDTPTARAALREGAERLGVTPGSLSHVLLTHVHIDHYGLAGPVRAWSGARVALHEREEELARRFVDRWAEERTRAAASYRAAGVPEGTAAGLLGAVDHLHRMYADFRPDLLLRGERGPAPGGGGWEWIHTPGHSPGHVVLHHPARRLLIAGDHVLPRISPNIGADLYVEDPLSDYLERVSTGSRECSEKHSPEREEGRMPGPYSMDLRQRVIAACESEEMTRAQAAQRYDVGESTIYDWLRRYRETGSFAPEPHAGGSTSELEENTLRDLVQEQSDATLQEYARLYEQRKGRRYSVATLSRALKRLKLSRKGRRYALKSTSSPRSRPSA